MANKRIKLSEKMVEVHGGKLLREFRKTGETPQERVRNAIQLLTDYTGEGVSQSDIVVARDLLWKAVEQLEAK